MEQTYEKAWAQDTLVLARSAAMSAGDISVAVRADLNRLLAASGGDRRKAVPAGFDKLVERNALSRTEATELAAIMDLLFDAPDGSDPKLGPRVHAYYSQLVLNPGSSPAAPPHARVVVLGDRAKACRGSVAWADRGMPGVLSDGQPRVSALTGGKLGGHCLLLRRFRGTAA